MTWEIHNNISNNITQIKTETDHLYKIVILAVVMGVSAVPIHLHCVVVSVAVCMSCPLPLVNSMWYLAGIIEEFGKFKRLINPGFNMINPCSEDVREVDMRIKLLSVGINHAITKDNVKVTITSAIAYRVVNPIQVYYILANALNRALI